MILADDAQHQSGLRVEIHFGGLAAFRSGGLDYPGIAIADFFRAGHLDLRVGPAHPEGVKKIGAALGFRELRTGLVAQAVLGIVGPTLRAIESLAEHRTVDDDRAHEFVRRLLMNQDRAGETHRRNLDRAHQNLRREFLPRLTAADGSRIALENRINLLRQYRSCRGRWRSRCRLRLLRVTGSRRLSGREWRDARN